MNKYTSLTIFAPLMFAIFWLISIIYINRSNVNSFNTWYLTRLVNFASDAAIEELRLNSEDLQLNAGTNNVVVNPDIAVREFESMMCENLGLPDTSYNRSVVARNYIKALAICVNDGYYIYSMQPIRNGEYEFISYPKLPYDGTFDPAVDLTQFNSDGKRVAVTLAMDKFYEITSYDGTFYKIDTVQDINGHDVVPSEKDKLHISEIINNNVFDTFSRVMYRVLGDKTRQTVTIPSTFSDATGKNRISGTTVMAVVDTAQMRTGISATAFGIGGSQFTNPDKIVCWESEEEGTIYCWWNYESDIEHYKSNWDMSVSGPMKYNLFGTSDGDHTYSAKRKKYVDDPYEAAGWGYSENWEVAGYATNNNTSTVGH